MPDPAYSGARILAVDDEQSHLVLLDRMLRRAGYTQVTTLQDSRQVMGVVRQLQPDLLLLDLMMPFVDGYTVLSQLQETTDPSEYLPVLVLTADATPQAWQRALSTG